MPDAKPPAAFPEKAASFVVVSAYFPPIVGGASTVTSNLLTAFRPERFRVLSETPAFLHGRHNAAPPPEVQVTRLGAPSFLRRLPFGRLWIRAGRYALIPRLRRALLADLAAIQAGRIVALYPSWPFLIAAYQASRQAGVPLITYHMDAPVEPAQAPWPDHRFIRQYERVILNHAAQRLVLSEALAEDFRQRFGLESAVIRHSVDTLKYPPAAPAETWNREPLQLVHTGVVEQLQYEGLKRLADTLSQHPELNARLVLCTPNDPRDLAACGLARPGVEIVSLSNAEVRQLQRRASVLVAVLPFGGEIRELERTAFPTKVVEYLCAGVPILAHTPAESFFGRHVRQHQYALLVDQPDEAALLAALQRLRDEAGLRRSLTTHARQTVAELFALPKVAGNFVRACGLDPTVLRPEYQ